MHSTDCYILATPIAGYACATGNIFKLSARFNSTPCVGFQNYSLTVQCFEMYFCILFFFQGDDLANGDISSGETFTGRRVTREAYLELYCPLITGHS